MKTARSDAVIMPNSEQAEHPSREGAMNRQMRPDNAMPIFHGTTGAHGLIPGSQKARGDCSPSGANTLDQVWPDAARPMPTEQPPPIPRLARLALVSHPVVAQTTGPEAKPNAPAWQAAAAAPAM